MSLKLDGRVGPGEDGDDVTSPATAADQAELESGEEQTAAPAARPAVRDRSAKIFPVSWPRIGLETLAVAGVAWLYVIWLYRLWRLPLRVPIYLASGIGDISQISGLIKGVANNGWFLHNPSLNAPFGQQYHDFPLGGETLQWLVIKALSLFTNDYGLIYNFYYLAGFGLDAAVTYVVLRHLRLGPWVSAVVSLIFAFLSYHSWHNEAHLLRVNYISVPLAVLLLVWLAQWRSWFLLDPVRAGMFGGRANVRWRRVSAALVIGLGIGAWETMATLFSIMLIAACAIVGAIRWREWQRLIVGVLLATPIGLGFLAGNLPTLLFWLQNGSNKSVAKRSLLEVEFFGLKLDRMILPADGSRLKPLVELRQYLDSNAIAGFEGGQYLGLVGVVGLVGLLYFAAAGVRAARSSRAGDLRPPSDRAALRETASTVVFFSIILGTVGGLSTIISLLGLSQLRTWNRIVLFIALLALVQLALWLSTLNSWALRRYGQRAKPVLAVGLVGVLALAWADGPPWVYPDSAANVAQISNDRTFVGQIDAAMPAGSAIMQYPVMTFPENGPLQQMLDYDPMRGYLADQNGQLRWSYGGIEGRPNADWQLVLTQGNNAVTDLPAVLGMGFTGLWIDTYGYPPASPQLAALRSALAKFHPIVSPDQRFLFYDLRPYRATLAQTDGQLTSLAVKTFGISPP